MTHRLLVNPGTPQAWEILLKPGLNRIGRGDNNDFKVPHGSVSGSHCEINISSAGALLKDVGSTNGTFVDRAPVREALLHSGQHIQLGSVDMVFESATPEGVVASPPAVATARLAPPAVAIPTARAVATAVAIPAARVSPTAAPVSPPPAAAVQVRPGGLRLSGSHAAAAPAPPVPVAIPAAAVEEVVEEEPPLPPPLAAPAGGALAAGATFCKFHPKSPARFFCPKCQKFFCDMCVATRTTTAGQSKTCRACGVPVTPVQARLQRVSSKGFFARIPGAFIYPFRGFGVVILFLAGAFFGGVDYLKTIGFLSGPFGWIMQAAFYGMLFLFMQNIIHTTSSDENEPLGFPDLDGLFGAAFQLGATVFVSFGLAIGLGIARLCEVDVPGVAIMAATILGCFYFPMAFLAVAMKDSVMAANPLVVFPAIMKMPLEYLATCMLLLGVFAVRKLGDLLSLMAGATQMSTRSMTVLIVAMVVQAAWAFLSIYLLCVTMRILGLLYITKKEKFGWFSH